MAPAATGRDRAVVAGTAVVFLVLGVFILSQGAGGASPVLVAVAVGATLVAFVGWHNRKEEGLRHRLADRGAWGAPAQGISPHIGKSVVLANQEGIAWVLAGAPPVVAGWDEVTSAKLEYLGQDGLRGFIRRFPPVPGGRLDIAVGGRAEWSFWLTSPGTGSLKAWSSACPAMRAALAGREGGEVGASPSSSPPSSLQALVAEVGLPFVGGTR
jgi:hypothetical protein